jgi:predicted DCC family thiol-disulfide oxidoreductase YuxK
MEDRIYPLEMLYDGNCPICRFDVAHLRRRNRRSQLRFTDIAAKGFDPTSYGKPLDQLLARIHARRADGRLVEGVEVFRLAYAVAGLGWLVMPTRLPGLRFLTEVAYTWFARHRVELSRRYGGVFARLTPACDDSACTLPGAGS